MDTEFINILMSKLEFPNDAMEVFLTLDAKLNQEQTSRFEELTRLFMDKEIDINPILEELNSMANEICVSNYTLHFLFLMKCSSTLYEKYLDKSISEDIYWHTISDLKYKLMECYDVYGVWGTSVASWFPRFFDMTRFALGRFQYEEIEFPYNQYIKNDIVVNKGDKVFNLHIPSAGPLSRELRMNSYYQAYKFFCDELKGQPLIVVCDSWLLYPKHEQFLPPNSNILGFMQDFEIVDSKETDAFSNAWRVFGKHHNLPPEKLPVDTSLQRAYANRLLNGGKTGTGFGILIFDGEKIL